MQQAHHVGEAGRAESGSEFLGDGGAAHDLAPLQHQRLEARLGEIGAADQSVVA